MRLSGSCPASAASAGLAHLEHGQHVVVLEQFEQTVQLVTELVDQNDAAVEQRLAGVEVVDDAREEVEHLRRDIAARGQVLPAGAQQQRWLGPYAAQEQSSAIELLDLTPERRLARVEMLRQGGEIERLISGLRDGRGLKQSHPDARRFPVAHRSGSGIAASSVLRILGARVERGRSESHRSRAPNRNTRLRLALLPALATPVAQMKIVERRMMS